MKTSQKGIDLIKKFEGVRLTAYKPVKTEKLWTIGYGHYGVDKNLKITQQQAEAFLKEDLEKFEGCVNKLNRGFNQNEFDALISFCYNCGQGNLQSLCKNRSKSQIANALLKYNKAGGKELAGLTKRRLAEKELFLTPINEQPKEKVNKKDTTKDKNDLPYKVKTKTCINIRTGAGTNYPKIRLSKVGEILTVWAVQKNWGKNGDEYFCLDYCERI